MARSPLPQANQAFSPQSLKKGARAPLTPNAPFATDNIRQPVLLLSHGFGGTARIMGWFGIAMARAGYIVIAVDHPVATRSTR